jgi:hypothetical protein
MRKRRRAEIHFWMLYEVRWMSMHHFQMRQPSALSSGAPTMCPQFSQTRDGSECPGSGFF